MSEGRILKISSEDEDIIVYYLQKHVVTTRKNESLMSALQLPPNSRGLADRLEFLCERGVLERRNTRPYSYRLKDINYVAEKIISVADASTIDYFIDGVSEKFSDKSLNVIEKLLNSRDSVKGHLAIYEDLSDEQLSKNYEILLDAIEHRYWLKLDMRYPKEIFHDARPIKLIFSDNNWYLFFDYLMKNKKRKARFVRLSFIRDIKVHKDYKYSDKKTFQKQDLDIYDEFISTFQNAMSLYDEKKQIATLKASKEIAHYFKEGMKKFFPSQQFVQENEDGSVIFKIMYTQELEILPFVQKWLPDLIILEPLELGDRYIEKLILALKNQNSSLCR